MNYDEILYRCIQEVKPSGIRHFFNILEEMKDTISLGAGEFDFVTPQHIQDAGAYSLGKGFTKRTSSAGVAELHREIMARLDRRLGLQYDFAHQIVVAVGGSGTIDLALRCVLNPDDEVIIPVPSFVCYRPLTPITGSAPVYMELKAENELYFTIAQLRVVPTPRTEVVVLPFPPSPTGDILERADLETLAGVLRDTNAMVLSGEIYAELTYGQKHVSPINLSGLYDRIIVVNGFSKSHAMTGWHMGYVCGPAPILQQMLKLHQFGIMSIPTTNQHATIEVMRNGDVDTEGARDEYDGRCRYLTEGPRRIDLPCFEPKDAFYVLPDIRGIDPTSDEFCKRFLMEKKVAVISGAAFGPSGEGFIRCCYAISMRDTTEVLTRMDNFLTDLCKKQAREG